jgi:hypothetical protein
MKVMVSQWYLRAQNQTRRLAVISSCSSLSSAPKMFGHGISLRMNTSMSPRNATTNRTVATSDTGTDQWKWWCRVRNTDGLVSTATSVAPRVSRRRLFVRES